MSLSLFSPLSNSDHWGKNKVDILCHSVKIHADELDIHNLHGQCIYMLFQIFFSPCRVHLDDGTYWSERAAKFQGKSHRQVLMIVLVSCTPRCTGVHCRRSRDSLTSVVWSAVILDSVCIYYVLRIKATWLQTVPVIENLHYTNHGPVYVSHFQLFTVNLN